jgi:hypothetical protein
MAQTIDSLPSMLEALSLNSSTATPKKKKKKERIKTIF